MPHPSWNDSDILFPVLTPEASAYIVFIVHHGLSDRTRIIIVVVCIVLFFLLLVCRLARIRQYRRAAAAAAGLPPPYGQPPQGPYAPPGYGGHVGTGGQGAPQHAARHGRQRERAVTAVRCLHPADAYAPPAGGYAPPSGPPGVYSPPAGYAAAPALPPVPPAHTTGQDHFRAQ
ncbi:hypothetical protein DFH09DRAFT_1406841 [Mycena vulgaris]|nr:hypothetical protein DFH09DRAFT_1406841 [Mycena vulgaris]